MSTIHISIIQMAVNSGDVEKNIVKTERYVQAAAKGGSDLIVFPEMWTTGFNFQLNKKIAGSQQTTLDALCKMAKQYNIWLTGSILFHDGQNQPTNSAFLINDAGEVAARYDKIHLFSGVGENKHVIAGDAPTCAETPWGKVGLSICYDIRYPELFRHYALQGATLILVPTGFPHPRQMHRDVLLRARAIENQLFIVSPNQVGQEIKPDGRVVDYCGHSAAYDPWGNLLIQGGQVEEMHLTTRIDMTEAHDIRKKMRVLDDCRRHLFYPEKP